MMNNPGIYLHIPFCKSKCGYCDFYSLCDYSYSKEYVKALERQLRAWEDHARNVCFDSVYIGGGTPTSIGRDLLLEVILLLKRYFTLSDGCEFTIEANPGTVNKWDLLAYREAGVNRISFGVQSARDHLLSRIGRIHTFKEAKEAILSANAMGFDNISADLMFALPDQKLEDLLYSIEEFVKLPLKHVSMYGLKVEPNTPFGRDPLLSLPNEDVQCEMYLKGVSLLESYGFMQYEISNFSLEGFESRHNLKYWKGVPYLGFGCAAHSFFDGKRFYAPNSIKDFCACSDFSPESGFYSSVELTEEDYAVEEIMLSLRTKQGMDIERLVKSNQAKSYAALLVKQGYGNVSGNRFSLTPKGMLVSNEIISEFLCYME